MDGLTGLIFFFYAHKNPNEILTERKIGKVVQKI